MNRRLGCRPLIRLLAAFAICSPVSAASVRLDVTPRDTFVGAPVQVRLTIENARTHEPPVFPEIPNATVRSNGAPNQQTSLVIVNGVTRQSMTLVYSWSVTPKEAGAFTIPSFTVAVDSESHVTQPVKVSVSRSETGDLMFVELIGSRPSVYVGEQLEVGLQIFIKPFSNPEFEYKMSAIDMIRRIDFRGSQWGVFQDSLERLLSNQDSPSLSMSTHVGAGGQKVPYYLFELKKLFYPDRAGKLDVGDINIVMTYPVRLTRNRDIFGDGQLALTETRPIAARLAASAITVKPIPTQQRPAIWNGAVGRYTLTASAKPLEVSVGDPVTLNMTLSGTGRMETLPAPPLAQLSELTRSFKVPSDPISGLVEGSVKRFSQSIRPTSASVTQIPPILFAYFDPKAEQFVTLHTDPIPIKVKPTQNLSMSQIVEAPGAGGKNSSQLTLVQGGILANYSDMDEVLAQQVYRPGWGTLIILIVPPVLFVIAFVSRLRVERLHSDTGLARRRSARRSALARIQAVSTDDPDAIAAAVGEALTHYVADRFNLPAGGLTRGEVVQHLRRHAVPVNLQEQMDRLLEQCESFRYARRDGEVGRRLADEAIAAIDALERERL